ncbi:hypothetical protein [Chryseobacterium taeanense]|uniref:hypothetical protein n=1 Tax=Chryseobacterium taeanense TaxID=311334 RepID=UPI0035AFB9D0
MTLNIGIKILLSVSIIILTFSSIGNKRSEEKSESFYHKKYDTLSETELAKMFDEERKYFDSSCTEETKKAYEDIKRNKLVFFHYFGMVESFKGNAEMNSLLKNYKIEVDSALYYCTIPSSLQNCYARIMRKEIDRKFGPKFIDSLRQISEIQYVKNNPDKIYRFEECDMVSRYPGDKDYNDFFVNSKRDFWKKTEYPIDYEFRKEQDLYSYISADFILYKNVKIDDIKTYLSFQNKKNYKFASYFINQLKNFIQDTQWIPAKSSGIPVNSEMKITIHFK